MKKFNKLHDVGVELLDKIAVEKELIDSLNNEEKKALEDGDLIGSDAVIMKLGKASWRVEKYTRQLSEIRNNLISAGLKIMARQENLWVI